MLFRSVEVMKWDTPALPANENVAGPIVRFRLPNWQHGMFKLLLEVEGKPEYNSEYTLLYTPKEGKREGTAIMNLD